MGTGKPTANICERVIKRMVEEKNHELYEQNPKGPKTRFAGEVIVTVDAAVRVNLYHAIDKDAVNFGIYYEQMRREIP